MTGIVLIGGKSRRFGRDKVLEQVGEKALIEHVMDVISPLFEDVLLIGHMREGLETFRIIEDIYPGCGPLGGIFTALTHITTDHCFVFAADMPHLDSALIEYMISVSDDHDAVIPLWSQGREPLHAIYHRRALPFAGRLLERSQYKIFNLLGSIDTLYINEDTLRRFTDPKIAFSNINTVHDIHHALKR